MSFHLLDVRSFGALCGAASGPVVSGPIDGITCVLCLELWGMYGERESAALGPEFGGAELKHFAGPPPDELAPPLACPDRLFDWVKCNGERGHAGWHWSWAFGLSWGDARFERCADPLRPIATPESGGTVKGPSVNQPSRSFFAARLASVLTGRPGASNRPAARASGKPAALASWIQPNAALRARGAAAWGRARAALWGLIRRAALKGWN